MKLENIGEYWHLLEAAKAGKTIQHKVGGSLWIDTDGQFNYRPDCYRIKPEPGLREWSPVEVPVGAIYRQPDFDPGVWLACAGTTSTGVWVFWAGKLHELYFGPMKREWEHSIDGGKTWLPCGVIDL